VVARSLRVSISLTLIGNMKSPGVTTEMLRGALA
jgi:hypothetical protein